MSQTVRLIGIDFGTSTSVVKVKRYRSGDPIGDSYITSGVTFGNGEADTKAATIVRRNGDGSLTCGADAAEPIPNSTIFQEFKMDLEDQDPEKRQQARELTAAFFRYLYERYDHQRSDLGETGDEERTLVSLPVKWGEETRQFMAQAAEKAGFKRVSIMDEPTAALYAALCRKMNEINQQGLLRTREPGYLLLVDMGAGTTDLAVCRYTVDSKAGEVIRADRIKNEIVATWPEDRNAATFGGREVDRVLEDYVRVYLTGCGMSEPAAAQFMGGSDNSAAKRWKENSVSKLLNEGKQVETCAFIANVAMFLPQQKPFPAFGREEFEEMLEDQLEQFKGLVTGCLQRASEVEPEILSKGLDLVILTGGHSAWYFTEELLNGTMPELALPQLERVQREKSRVIRLTNPQETVALGLVYSQLPFQVGKEKPAKELTKEPAKEESRPARDGDTAASTIRMFVHVNGRICASIQVPAEADQDAVVAAAMANDDVQRSSQGMEFVKAIDMGHNLVNLIFQKPAPGQKTNPPVKIINPGNSEKPCEFPGKLTKEQFERVRNFFSIGITPPGMRCSVASNAVSLTYFMANIASGSIRVDQNGFNVQYADSKEDIRAIPARESHHERISWGEFLRGEIRVAQAITLDALFGFHSMVALRFERDGENVQKHLARAAVSRRYDDLERIHVLMKQLQTSMREFLHV